MTSVPLQGLDVDSIENVYIFIADSVRYDALPEAVSSRGLAFKTAAHALCTPQSIPTIVTGLYPPRHGASWFFHTLPHDIRTLLDLDAVRTGYNELVWSGGAVQDILRDPDSIDLGDVSEPFLAIEHDNGGHAPYVNTPDEISVSTMYERIPDREALRRRYEETIAESTNRFERRLALLESEGVLDETLVIYLSDHGELLGEHGGFVGHAFPAAPEVAYVPTVFVHESLDAETRPEFVHHADVFPTVLETLGYDVDTSELDGESLLSPIRPDRPAYAHGVVHPPERLRESPLDPIYDTSSVWTTAGGYTFPQTGPLRRSVLSVYDALQTAYTASFNGDVSRATRLARTARYYFGENNTFGNPSLERDAAAELVERTRASDVTATRRTIDEETKRQLQDLGYH